MRRHIALVEDNPDNQILFQAILEDDYEVASFESGVEALEAFQHNPPELVLLDISLPGMCGEEVLGRLRDDPRLQRLPVIALTAHAMAGDHERFLSLGFDGYVSKPLVDEALLLNAIHRLLNQPDGGCRHGYLELAPRSHGHRPRARFQKRSV
jgi:CheY-like chemotaxis protein